MPQSKKFRRRRDPYRKYKYAVMAIVAGVVSLLAGLFVTGVLGVFVALAIQVAFLLIVSFSEPFKYSRSRRRYFLVSLMIATVLIALAPTIDLSSFFTGKSSPFNGGVKLQATHLPAAEVDQSQEQEVVVLRNDQTYYIRRSLSELNDIVQRFDIVEPSQASNPALLLSGMVRVNKTEAVEKTAEAFQAGYAANNGKGSRLKVQVDDNPPYRVNGLFLGGNHSLIGSKLNVENHGLEENSIGRTCKLNDENFLIMRIPSANEIDVIRTLNGGPTLWSIPSTPAKAGRLNCAGAKMNSDLVLEASRIQIFPGLQNFETQFGP